MRALQERRLIEEIGRKAAPGKPVLYGTTEQFLHQFKLNDLSQLPELPDAKRKRLVADLSLEKQVLQDVAEGNF